MVFTALSADEIDTGAGGRTRGGGLEGLPGLRGVWRGFSGERRGRLDAGGGDGAAGGRSRNRGGVEVVFVQAVS